LRELILIIETGKSCKLKPVIRKEIKEVQIVLENKIYYELFQKLTYLIEHNSYKKTANGSFDLSFLANYINQIRNYVLSWFATSVNPPPDK
jgi:hypothetical protein